MLQDKMFFKVLGILLLLHAFVVSVLMWCCVGVTRIF
jgi:hypothetical protein